MAKKQTQPSLRTSERTIIGISTALIVLMSVTSFGFLFFYYLFIPLLVVNLIAFIRKQRLPETLLRVLLLLNIIAAAASIYLIIGWNASYLLR